MELFLTRSKVEVELVLNKTKETVQVNGAALTHVFKEEWPEL